MQLQERQMGKLVIKSDGKTSEKLPLFNVTPAKPTNKFSKPNETKKQKVLTVTKQKLAQLEDTSYFSNPDGEMVVKKGTEISGIAYDKVQELLVVLQETMLCEDKTSETYQKLVQKLPSEYKNKYHFLIQASISYPEC